MEPVKKPVRSARLISDVYRGTPPNHPHKKPTHTSSKTEAPKSAIYDEPKKRRSWRVLILIITLLVGFAAGFLYARQKNAGYITVSSPDFSYSVKFSAQQITKNDKTYLKGKDPVTQADMLLGISKSSTNTECSSSESIKAIDRVTILGSAHNVCYGSTSGVYTVNFQHNDSWYFCTVFTSDSTSTLDINSVKATLSTIKIL